MKPEDTKGFAIRHRLSTGKSGGGPAWLRQMLPLFQGSARQPLMAPGQLVSLPAGSANNKAPGWEERGRAVRDPTPGGCGPGGRLLPWPSLKNSLSSWELEGHRAEIHRCFSLLGRGRLSCHKVQSTVSQGQGGETRLGGLGMVSGLGACPPHSPVCPQARAPPSSEPNRAGPEAAGHQLHPWRASGPVLQPAQRSSPPTPKPTHSVRALSRNWCFAWGPWRSWRRNTWPGTPCSFRLRSFTWSSAILAWTNTANFPSLRDRGR